jgi:radical SAM superfamily enzyme YgiQ (UPF0313 family)
MRIALIYPPPWKISAPGEEPDRSGDGPPGPRLISANVEEGDFLEVPQGVLSLAAQAIRAGHDVTVLNLSNFAWRDVEVVIGNTPAELYGLSCFTANRRGAALVASLIRRTHPTAHITVGGPHVTPLPAETLRHWPDVDTVVMGEGELTFLELIRQLEAGLEAKGIAGTAWRESDGAVVGEPRNRIDELDSLAAPLDYFPTHVLITSRGCPGRCTFCGSRSMWGAKVRFHSVDYVLRCIERAVREYGITTLAIKDDSFTVRRDRAIAICRGIRDRGLRILWACDTRADMLDDELVREMRLAGCQRLSLGVESGCPRILEAMRKNVTPEQVLEATRLAKRYGLEVRYYVILGSRGETDETVEQTMRLSREGAPAGTSYSPLGIYPGTEEFEALSASTGATTDVFFSGEGAVHYLHEIVPGGQKRMHRWWAKCAKPQVGVYTAAECESALGLLPDCAAAHLDLGAAYLRAGKVHQAEEHIRRAVDLGYPVPSIAFAYFGAIALARGSVEGLKAWYDEAMRADPAPVVVVNYGAVQRWLGAGGPKSGKRLELVAGHPFAPSSVASVRQPTAPGPTDIVDQAGRRRTVGLQVSPGHR